MNLRWEVFKSRGACLKRHWNKQANCGLTATQERWRSSLSAVLRGTFTSAFINNLELGFSSFNMCLCLFMNVNLNGERGEERESRASPFLSRKKKDNL